MKRHIVKNQAVTLITVLALFTVIFSAVYNQPLRFRPKITTYAKSVFTLNPSSSAPDHIILGPAENPSRSQRLSWRTSKYVKNGEVRYWASAASRDNATVVKADLNILESPELRADRPIHRFSAVLEDLEAATIYHYMVGDSTTDAWSPVHSFTTASEIIKDFTQ